MKLDSFKHLYIEELRDLYDAETQLLKALALVAESAILPELKNAFARHLEQTQTHVDRLGNIFAALGTEPTGNPCKTMTGLIAECNDLLKEERWADPGVLDAALIAAAQKIEHFEIAGYGCARTFAEILGERDAARILQQTLDDEAEMDRLLTSLAMRSVNVEAVAATDQHTEIPEAVVSALEAVAR